MAQPASSSFSPPLADAQQILAFEHVGDGPANRVQSELALALNVAQEEKWSMGASLRFIIMSCGMFWAAAGFAIYALR